MVLKGYELSDNHELLDEQEPGQSAYADNECPDIAMLELVQPQVPVQPEGMPPFDFHQCICRLGGNATTMFKALDNHGLHIPLDQLLCTANALEEVSGKTIHIQLIM